MNQWIKYLENEELHDLHIEHGIPTSTQKLMGFFRKSDSFVLFCSIIREDDGTFEFYCNCNQDVVYSFCPDNKSNTFEECKKNMLDFLIGLSDVQPSMWGIDLNEETRKNLLHWDALGIEEEYPAYYHNRIW